MSATRVGTSSGRQVRVYSGRALRRRLERGKTLTPMTTTVNRGITAADAAREKE